MTDTQIDNRLLYEQPVGSATADAKTRLVDELDDLFLPLLGMPCSVELILAIWQVTPSSAIRTGTEYTTDGRTMSFSFRLPDETTHTVQRINPHLVTTR